MDQDFNVTDAQGDGDGSKDEGSGNDGE